MGYLSCSSIGSYRLPVHFCRNAAGDHCSPRPLPRTTQFRASPLYAHQTPSHSTSPLAAPSAPSPPPSLLLPLPTALAKLQDEPRNFLGWELRLADGNADQRRHATSSSSRRGRRKRTFHPAAADRTGSHTAANSSSHKLGRVEEVLTAGGEGSAPGSAAGEHAVKARSRLRHSGGATRGSFAPTAGAASIEAPVDPAQPRLQILLRAVRQTVVQEYDFAGSEEFIVRLDPEVVPYADMASRTLLVHPPAAAGLMQQGRRSLLLQLLHRELRVLAGELDPPSSQPQPAMPTRRQLLGAGRGDLVELITAAGGFSEVALQLGLRGARRPRGYWSGPGSWGRLGAELAAFVAGGWVELPHPDDPRGGKYWYNQISHRTTSRRPPPLRRLPSAPRGPPSPGGRPSGGWGLGGAVAENGGGGDSNGDGGGSVGGGMQWVVAEAAADRVMPSRSVVLQARRYDLHNAIVAHGGYLTVATRLGRRVTWAPSKHLYDSPAAVRRELAVAAKELQLPSGVLPTPRELRESGYGTLLTAVRRHDELRDLLGIRARTRRRVGPRPRGRWDDLEALAVELATFAASAAAAAAAVTDGRAATHDQTALPAVMAADQLQTAAAAATTTAATTSTTTATTTTTTTTAATTSTTTTATAVTATALTDSDGVQEPASAPAAAAAAAAAAASPGSRRSRGRPRNGPPPSSPTTPEAASAATSDAATSTPTAAAAAERPRRMPSLNQLRAAGRHDLLYAVAVRHADRRREVAQLAGLWLEGSRRGTNRGVLSFDAVAEAIRARSATPKAIREFLQQRRRVDISRQYLTGYLARAAAEGRLVKVAYGQYDLPDAVPR